MSCQFVFPSRGTALKTGGGGAGLYRVQGLSGPYFLITGFPLEDADIVARSQTLNGGRVLYSMGPAFGEAAVTGEILLGPVSGSGDNQRLARLINWFEKNRVSNTRKPVTVSAGSKGYKMYVHRLTLAEPDPEFNTQRFAVQGSLATPGKK